MSNSNHSSTPGALPPSQQTSASTETWITAAEAASILHLTPRTVLNRAASGKLPARIPEDMPFTYDGRQNYLIGWRVCLKRHSLNISAGIFRTASGAAWIWLPQGAPLAMCGSPLFWMWHSSSAMPK